MNGYDLEYIDKLRIHELRDFAKKLGVNSPTTMKKEELIGRITSIMESDFNDQDTSNKYIKNCKELDFFDLLVCKSTHVLDSLLNINKNNIDKPKAVKSEQQETPKTNAIVMKQKKVYSKDTPYSMDNMVGLSFSVKQNEIQYGSHIDYVIVQGYVDIHPNGYGILRHDGFLPSEDDSYMTTNFIKEHNLKKGVYISGKAKFIINGKPKVVYELDSIENGNDRYNARFEDMAYNGLGEEFYLDKFELSMKRGERQYIKSMTLKDAVDLGYDLVDENGCNVKLINIKAKPEERYKSHQKMQIIDIPFNKPSIEVVNAVQLIMERVKREIETGMSNVIIIYNFSDYIRMVNSVVCDGVIDLYKFSNTMVNKIHNLMYLAKHIDRKLNSSVICIDKNGSPSDISSIMELEFAPLFNAIHDNVLRKN